LSEMWTMEPTETRGPILTLLPIMLRFQIRTDSSISQPSPTIENFPTIWAGMSLSVTVDPAYMRGLPKYTVKHVPSCAPNCAPHMSRWRVRFFTFRLRTGEPVGRISMTWHGNSQDQLYPVATQPPAILRSHPFCASAAWAKLRGEQPFHSNM